jgi:hypothetical protein
MNIIRIIAVGIFVILIQYCKNTEEKYNKNMRNILEQFRQTEFPVLNKKQHEQWMFYKAIYRNEVDMVQVYLDKGFDPNYCHGECGWIDSNPLAVVTETFYDTYSRYLRGEKIVEPIPDVETLQVLMTGGADINRRPYIWDRVHRYNNNDLEDHWCTRGTVNGVRQGEETDMKVFFIKDVNRIIEAFLKAGADPDMLGHPYPFSWEALKARITDEQAKEYFAKGSRAINEAIEKGIAWESQVDLLLKYTVLDEESLKAAERSNDPEMVKKIQMLWEVQKSK